MNLIAAATSQPATTAKSVSAVSLFFHLVVALVVILVVIAVAARLMKGRVGTVRRTDSPLSVIARQSLGKGVQIAVVRAGNDEFVVGITAHQVSRLGRYTDPSAVPAPSEGSDGPGFRTNGQGWLKALQSAQEKTVRRA